MLRVGTELLSGFERLRRLAVIATMTGCLALAGACGSKAPEADSTCPPPVAEDSAEALPGISEFAAKPKWEQDFRTQTELDTNVWHHELDPVVPTYNKEAQAYTDNPKNVRVDCGSLIIEAHRENYTDPAGREVEYTSGRIDTRDSLNFEYGKVEVTMILPEGAGAWPAFWFLSANNPHTSALDPTEADWAKDYFYLHDGEIDGMEAGHHGKTNQIGFHVHTFSKQDIGKYVHIPDASTTPHTYGVEVTPNQIVWTVDGERKFTFKKPSNNPKAWPFGKGNELYLILNLAMGGDYAGPIDPANDSWRLQVFDVKYYPYVGKSKAKS